MWNILRRYFALTIKNDIKKKKNFEKRIFNDLTEGATLFVIQKAAANFNNVYRVSVAGNMFRYIFYSKKIYAETIGFMCRVLRVTSFSP